MDKTTICIKGYDIDVYSMNTVIVGTGAAGFNAADSLYALGQRDIAIVTEGVNMGTSRNTGSDKQTYYKLTLSGDAPDSVMEMARTLFKGGSMHGDIALTEAALSARCFCKLAGIGVPFPHNRYGEYAGYKTDHDPRQRATSAGPLTSRFMTEKLEEQVRLKGIRVFDGFQVIGILTDGNKNAIGLITLDHSRLNSVNMGFTLFNCTNIIYATGGPAGIYLTSVYPESQTGATGTALEAGAAGVNLTESQYGIASVKFRWNVSGTYQQVLPRYLSTNKDGVDQREFLTDYFPDKGKLLDAVFLKGYQWPFDPGKISDYGSSIIDVLVFNETFVKGRRVFLDFTNNPCCSEHQELDFSLLGVEAYKYLENSGALFGTPVQRLQKMNQPAIELYMNNGIDITKEWLEIAVCAQHNNGGLAGNIWWESNIRHFFPVGEVNGTFGVYRPGGSALNSTQVGSLRAAQYINENYRNAPLEPEPFASSASVQIESRLELAEKIVSNLSQISNVVQFRERLQARMTRYGAHIRSSDGAREGAEACRQELENFDKLVQISSLLELPQAFKNRDILIAQLAYLSSIYEYIEKGGRSRGSYLIYDANGSLPCESLPESFRYSLDDGRLSKFACITELVFTENRPECKFEWEPVRPIPQEDNWFENVWNTYREGNVIK